MSYKQWNAVVMLASQMGIAAWLVLDTLAHPLPEATVAAIAARLLWVGLVMIVVNIVVLIVTTIIGSMVTRNAFRDEGADERDKAIYAKSMRNAYFVVSVGGVATLLLLAFGQSATVAAYAVFTAGMLAGAAGTISQLYYYRFG